MHPYRGDLAHRSYELKMNLVRAALAGGDAIREVAAARTPAARRSAHPRRRPARAPELAEAAARQVEFQFQAWDMLAGRIEPELGGQPRPARPHRRQLLPEQPMGIRHRSALHWHLRDPRRRRFSALLSEVQRRYQRPLTIAETSHVGAAGRSGCARSPPKSRTPARNGVPVHGVCLYPAVDRPDWENPAHWHNSGLWDVEADDPALPAQPR